MVRGKVRKSRLLRHRATRLAPIFLLRFDCRREYRRAGRGPDNRRHHGCRDQAACRPSKVRLVPEVSHAFAARVAIRGAESRHGKPPIVLCARPQAEQSYAALSRSEEELKTLARQEP